MILDSLEEGESLPLMPSRNLPENDIEEQIQNILVIPSLDEVALREQRKKVITEFQGQFLPDSSELEAQLSRLSAEVSKQYIDARKDWVLNEQAKLQAAEHAASVALRRSAEAEAARMLSRAEEIAKQRAMLISKAAEFEALHI